MDRRAAELLADEGYALVLTDLNDPAETEAAVRMRGSDALSSTGDISSETDVAELATRVRDRFGRVDVLVNNAGISCIAPAEDTSVEQWQRVLEVNLVGDELCG